MMWVIMLNSIGVFKNFLIILTLAVLIIQLSYYILCGEIKGFNSPVTIIMCQVGNYRMLE